MTTNKKDKAEKDKEDELVQEALNITDADLEQPEPLFFISRLWLSGQGRDAKYGQPTSRSSLVIIPKELAKRYGLLKPCSVYLIPKKDGIFLKKVKLESAQAD